MKSSGKECPLPAYCVWSRNVLTPVQPQKLDINPPKCPKSLPRKKCLPSIILPLPPRNLSLSGRKGKLDSKSNPKLIKQLRKPNSKKERDVEYRLILCYCPIPSCVYNISQLPPPLYPPKEENKTSFWSSLEIFFFGAKLLYIQGY